MSPIDPAFVREQAGFVRALAKSLVADPNLADDLAQETWLTALTRPPRNPSNLRGWLGTVAGRMARRRRRETTRRTRRETEVARTE